MFRKILVAIDGSKKSEQALETAVQEAKAHGAEVHTVYVIETGLFSSIPMDNTWEAIYGLLEKQGREALGRAQELAGSAGVRMTTHLKQGHAGNEILKLAGHTGADLVVIGSHGKSELDRLLLGSVSSYVVKYSTVTTLVVRS